ncbi:FecCD family ABC transporter permease [Salinicoccus hispanicus]|uniref:Iron chelate uptake ABC transporter family permease subunit n=1 Tax=Salinicoccus hispanicus TaxID=157225 RepID=A0A6N8U704_9STAP|nr:iron ABC transporter permease [Salinicoccus hispanicus]MXQ51419.1 iron chelate uptake ABC transporter family permease subunit [Salinicoccus hispanicus]
MNRHTAILSLLIILAGTFSLLIGSADLFELNRSQWQNIIFNIRLPRVLFAAVLGAALAMSGVVFQIVLRNPMADSFTLGMANAAVLGSAAAVTTALPLFVRPLFSILAGLLALFIVLMAARRLDTAYRPETLIIIGVLLGAMMSGVLYIIVLIAPDQTESIARYMFGSLSGSSYDILMLTAVLTFVCGIILHRSGRALDLLNLGDVRAYSLGVNVKKVRPLLLITASIPPLVGISFTGMIALVGIIVPQMILYFKPLMFRPLLIISALYGALYIIIVDTIGRTIIAPIQIPTGVMVMISAVPLFIFLMYKRMLVSRR